MPIRLEHYPGIAAGMSAYAAALARASERRRKRDLDIWQEELNRNQALGIAAMRQRPGARYRAAMGGGFGGRLAEPALGLVEQLGGAPKAGGLMALGPPEAAPAGPGEPRLGAEAAAAPAWGWQDPLAMAATTQDKLRIRAQQEANERARKRGKQIPYPQADPRFIPPPTEAEQRHQWDLENRAQGRRWDLEDKAQARQWEQEDLALKQTFDEAKARYEDRLAQINELKKEGPNAWRGTDVMGIHFQKANKFAALVNNLEKAREAMRGEEGNTKGMIAFYQKATDEMEAFLEGFDPNADLVPREERPGATYKRDGAMLVRPQDPSESPKFVGWEGGEPPTKEIGGIPHVATWEGDHVGYKPLPKKEATDPYWEEFRKYFELFSPPGGVQDAAGAKKTADTVHQFLKDQGFKRPAEKPTAEPGNTMFKAAGDAAVSRVKATTAIPGAEDLKKTREQMGLAPVAPEEKEPATISLEVSPELQKVMNMLPSKQREALQRRIASAKAGNKEDQDLLDAKGIPWRMQP